MESCVFATVVFIVGMGIGMLALSAWQFFNPPKRPGVTWRQLPPEWKRRDLDNLD